MAVLGKIRNQFGWVMMGLVILGIGGFLFMDVSSVGRGMGAQQRIVAKINGEDVLRDDFDVYIKNYEGAQASQEQIREQAWKDLLSNVIYKQQAKKLGIVVTDEELTDLFTGQNISPLVAQQFAQMGAGVDRNMIEQQRNAYFQAKEKSPSELTNQEIQFLNAWEALEKSVADEQLSAKYIAMLQKGVYAPAWMVNAEYARKNRTYDFNFSRVLYADVDNAEVSISDADLTAYIEANPKAYERKANVSIEYVVFDVQPSAADTANFEKTYASMVADFAKTSGEGDTTYAQTNRIQLDPIYYTKEKWQDASIKDTLFSLDKGQVYGPYYDNLGQIKMVKVMDRKVMPDSVACRHIMKPVNRRDVNTMQAAYVELDSLRKLLVAGTANFNDLVAAHSMDMSTKDKGGVMGYRGRGDSYGAPFESFIFDVGQKDSFEIIQTQNAMHLIQITDYKFGENKVGLRLAYKSEPILPSAETERTAEAKANEFMANNRTLEELKAAAKKNPNLRLSNAAGLEINDYVLTQGLQGAEAAEIIKWAHKEAKDGEVAGRIYPFTDPKYNTIAAVVVPALVKKSPEGLASIEDNSVRAEVERIVRNEKKAEIILKKLEGVTSLEAMADKYSSAKVETANGVRYDAPFIREVGGVEPKLTAVADVLETGKVSKPFAGEQGVYMIQLINKQDGPSMENMPNAVQQKRNFVMRSLLPAAAASPAGFREMLLEAIQDDMNIKDNRADMY